MAVATHPAAHPAHPAGATGTAEGKDAPAQGPVPEPVPPGKQLSDGNGSGTSFGQGPDDKISFFGAPTVAQRESKHVNAKQMKDPKFVPGGDALGELARLLFDMGLIRPARDPDEVAAEEKARKEAEAEAAKEKAAAEAKAKAEAAKA